MGRAAVFENEGVLLGAGIVPFGFGGRMPILGEISPAAIVCQRDPRFGAVYGEGFFGNLWQRIKGWASKVFKSGRKKAAELLTKAVPKLTTGVNQLIDTGVDKLKALAPKTGFLGELAQNTLSQAEPRVKGFLSNQISSILDKAKKKVGGGRKRKPSQILGNARRKRRRFTAGEDAPTNGDAVDFIPVPNNAPIVEPMQGFSFKVSKSRPETFFGGGLMFQ